MKTFGHCRFSYFGVSDTGRSIVDLNAAQQLLWNPLRMAVRFHLFENITLPSIRNQSDQDFVFVIISSLQMPGIYRDRLEAVVAGIPNIRIHWTDKTHITKASRSIMEEASNDGKDRALHFRIDDDDALAVDFVRHLRQAAEPLDPTAVISFPYGVIGYLDGGVAKHCAFRKFGIAIGYRIVQSPEDFRSPFHIQHLRFAKAHPGVVDDSFGAYHYTRHSTNNTDGYATSIHSSGRTADSLAKISHRQNTELPVNTVTTAEAEDIISKAFPYTNGAFMRSIIASTMNPEEIMVKA